MGGNSDVKEDELSFWDRFYGKLKSAGYVVLDFLSGGYVSKLEKDVSYLTKSNKTNANRVMSLNVAHERKKREWEKRIGTEAAKNEGLVFRLSDAHKELAEQNETISELEGKVAEAEGTLVLAQNELAEVKDAYSRVQAIIDANPELEGAMADLEELYKKLSIENPDTRKNALGIIRRQRALVRIAYEKVEETERKGVLGRAYVKLADKRAIFVLDEKNRVEAMSPAAQKLIGSDITGKDAGYVVSRLGLMINHVAPTYEGDFSVTIDSVGSLKNARINVNLERYYYTHIGSFVIVEPVHFWEQRRKRTEAYTLVAPKVFDDGAELTRMIGETIVPDYGVRSIGIDLRATTEMSDEIARRIGGLTQSKYFRNRIKMVVSNSDVYNKLMRYDVPKELIIEGLERDEGLEGVAATVPIKS